MQVQDSPAVVLLRIQQLLFVSVDQERQCRARQTRGWFDNPRSKMLFLLFIVQGQLLAAVFLMSPQVPTGVVWTFAPVGNSFQFSPTVTEWKAVLDIDGAFGIV